MGCFTSRIAGPEFTTINADMASSPGVHREKPHASALHYKTAAEHERDLQRIHYETPAEHERDLQRLSTSQHRDSLPPYVDPDDLPMPPKTTHQHYHRRTSENQPQQESWKQKMAKAVLMPADQVGMMLNTGVGREEAKARGTPARASGGTMMGMYRG